jgi:hypothetical protein
VFAWVSWLQSSIRSAAIFLATRMSTVLSCSTPTPTTRTTQRYHEATTKTNASSWIGGDATQRLQRGPAMIRARIRRSVERLGQKGEGAAAGLGVVSINRAAGTRAREALGARHFVEMGEGTLHNSPLAITVGCSRCFFLHPQAPYYRLVSRCCSALYRCVNQ